MRLITIILAKFAGCQIYPLPHTLASLLLANLFLHKIYAHIFHKRIIHPSHSLANEEHTLCLTYKCENCDFEMHPLAAAVEGVEIISAIRAIATLSWLFVERFGLCAMLVGINIMVFSSRANTVTSSFIKTAPCLPPPLILCLTFSCILFLPILDLVVAANPCFLSTTPSIFDPKYAALFMPDMDSRKFSPPVRNT